MNTTEQFIFSQHMKNINTRWEDFARENMAIQSPESLSIIYGTDLHYIRKYAYYTPSYYKLCEMVEFSGYIGADLLAITGDIVDGNTTMKRQYRDLYDVLGVLKKSKTTSVALSKGNHDGCEWYAYQKRLGEGNWLTEKDWYVHAVNPLRVQYPMVLDEENPQGGYYYIDYPVQKIRVINLNTSDSYVVLDEDGVPLREYCSQWHLGMKEKQLKWLTKALTFKEEGWSVIFMSHDFLVPFGDDFAGVVSNGEQAWEIIKAFKNCEKGTAKNTAEYYQSEVMYDFTKNPSNDVLVYMFGHVHADNTFKKDGITAVSTINILKAEPADWDSPESEVIGGWDFVTVDKKKRMFYSKRYGVEGKDRSIEL